MIIRSLLDTDLYKFTMMQVVLHHFPGAQVEYTFKSRTAGADLAPYLDEIRREVGALAHLRFVADELDYLVEARQAVLLWEHSRGDKLERIARVYRDYTTSRVLTTEFIDGVPLIEIMIARREGNRAYLDALAADGHDLDRIVRHLDWNMLNQVYVFGYFHADLHPANLFILPGDAIGYVDFGIVGQLPDRVRDSLTRYWSRTRLCRLLLLLLMLLLVTLLLLLLLFTPEWKLLLSAA